MSEHFEASAKGTGVSLTEFTEGGIVRSRVFMGADTAVKLAHDLLRAARISLGEDRFRQSADFWDRERDVLAEGQRAAR